MKLKIENRSSLKGIKKTILANIIKNAASLKDVEDALNRHDITFKSYTFGRGGNHVWIAQKKTGERVAIITEN